MGILLTGGMSFDLFTRFTEQEENGAPPWCTSVAKLATATLVVSACARARCTFSILAHWLQWTGFCHLHFSPVSLLDFKHTSTSWCNSIRLKVREQTLIVKNREAIYIWQEPCFCQQQKKSQDFSQWFICQRDVLLMLYTFSIVTHKNKLFDTKDTGYNSNSLQKMQLLCPKDALPVWTFYIQKLHSKIHS